MGSSSSAALPTGRGAGRVGKKGKGTGRGGGMEDPGRTGAALATTTSSFAEHRTSMVDCLWRRLRDCSVTTADGHSSHEAPVQEQPRVEVHSAQEQPEDTTVPEASPDMERPGWETWPDRTELPDWTEGPGGSGGGDGRDELTDSEGDVQVDGATMYKRGTTRLLPPAMKAEAGDGYTLLESAGRTPSLVCFAGQISRGLSRCLTFYRCEDGYEEEAARVLEAECRRLLQNLRHEARPQAIQDYYATRGIKK
ncbi:hypothetical protein ZWY2020_024347 [Hordeum vulgare]|nr:hypothetical protein ZWY2020_024347 [Hordeum vulgare]